MLDLSTIWGKEGKTVDITVDIFESLDQAVQFLMGKLQAITEELDSGCGYVLLYGEDSEEVPEVKVSKSVDGFIFFGSNILPVYRERDRMSLIPEDFQRCLLGLDFIQIVLIWKALKCEPHRIACPASF